MKLNVTVTKTSNGLCDYIQIMSDDTVTVNVVFVADQINVQDLRSPPESEPARRKASRRRAGGAK